MTADLRSRVEALAEEMTREADLYLPGSHEHHLITQTVAKWSRALRAALAEPRPDPDERVKRGFRIGIEAAAKAAEAEAEEYEANAKACDAAGNVHGGTADTHGAIACRAAAQRIRDLVKEST